MKHPGQQVAEGDGREPSGAGLDCRMDAVVDEAVRQDPRWSGEFPQRRGRIGGDFALQALPELRVSVVPEAADGRHRSAQVPRRESVGEIVLGCRLPCHRPGLVTPVASQPARLVDGHLVQVAIGGDG
jgi:hypothetical protein